MQGEKERLSLDQLLQLHARKTGALIRAAVQLGAVAAGVDEHGLPWEALVTYAERVGLAFQVVDDILDVTAEPELLGKSKGKDSTENKTTFLTYYTVDEAREYAVRLTHEAIDALAPWDGQGILCELARYLAQRMY
jgi:geranylgeranyl pyrophosphate synthase